MLRLYFFKPFFIILVVMLPVTKSFAREGKPAAAVTRQILLVNVSDTVPPVKTTPPVKAPEPEVVPTVPVVVDPKIIKVVPKARKQLKPTVIKVVPVKPKVIKPIIKKIG